MSLRAARFLPLLLLSCGEPANAVLEVRMHLPVRVDATSSRERPFARIAIVPSDVDLDAPGAYEEDAQLFDLAASGCNVELSIVAPDPRRTRVKLERGREHGLSMLIWFCPSARPCERKEAPRWLVDFDRALWAGERSIFEADVMDGECSSWELADAVLPPVQAEDPVSDEFAFELRVNPCSVLGCLDEESKPAATHGFCSLDGSHPCDE